MEKERQELQKVRLKTPVTDEDLAALKLGDVVFLDGLICTGREGVYRKVVDGGEPLPFDLAAITNVNFHCSPAASVAKDGTVRVGAVTATASFRFAKWMQSWFGLSGAKVVIGKGGMSEADYKRLFVPAGAVYLTTVGYGTGALLGRGIKRVLGAHWIEELGLAQALWVFEVESFGPFLVESDRAGNSLFERNNRAVNSRIDALYQGLGQPSLSRFGETGDRKDEVI